MKLLVHFAQVMQAVIIKHRAKQVCRHLGGPRAIDYRFKHFALVALRHYRAREQVMKLAVAFHYFCERAHVGLHLVDLIARDGSICERFAVAAGDCSNAHLLTSPSSSMYLFSILVLSSGRISRRMMFSASWTDCS